VWVQLLILHYFFAGAGHGEGEVVVALGAHIMFLIDSRDIEMRTRCGLLGHPCYIGSVVLIGPCLC
jgi:hypothetical protein